MSVNSDSLSPYRRVTVVGSGVIGTSWTGLFLARGLEVTVNDPLPDVEQRVRVGLEEVLLALDGLGLPTAGLTNGLRFEADLAMAVADADAVQENGPERLDLKQQIWTTIEKSAPDHTLLATSTSGIPATDIAQAMRHPERLVVGHPFNPPHLMPLVEVVPGKQTSAETVQRALDFYTAMGKKPQVLRKEVPGFVANRLQAAIFRECVHLVTQGVVTEAELDEIVTSSIGLRWAVGGPFRTFHLGGGPGGLPHFLQHLGPALEALWQQLGSPSLDAPTVELLIRQAQEAFGDRPVDILAAERDRVQIAVLKALGESPTAESA